MIRYMSTRGSGIKVSAADGVIKGIAEDKGLYFRILFLQFLFRLKSLEI